MSTGCFIGIEKSKGNMRGIICAYDGYPEYTGTILTYKYRNLSKIYKLISLGDIRILGEKLYPNPKYEHTYLNHQKQTVFALHRDMNSKLNISDNVSKADLCKLGIYYAYVWNVQEKTWHTYKIKGERTIEEIYVDYSESVSDMVKMGYMTPVKKTV